MFDEPEDSWVDTPEDPDDYEFMADECAATQKVN